MQILSGLANGQVLQRLSKRRGANATLTGSSSNGPITATISDANGSLAGWDQRKVGQAAKGKFSISLANIPVGGPFTLELKVAGENAVRVEEFFVGDVWLLAGQSNMEGVGDMDGAAESHPLIRAFSMRREWALAKDRLHVMAESPDHCHNNGLQCTPEESRQFRQTAAKGVGVGIFFAREMLQRSGIPQGLLCTAHGGTTMTQWSPTDKQNMYVSMLDSWKATGQPVAGLLWYQGESDASPVDAPLYTKRMKALVAASRRDLRQRGLPWVIVQLARVFGLRSHEDTLAWNAVQEEQRLLPKVVPHLETVAAIDLELDDCIHIGSKDFPLLAQRMARAADRLVYGAKEKRPPQLEKIGSPVSSAGATTLDVHFTDVVGGLKSHGEAQGFALVNPEGHEQRFIYKTTLHGSFVRLHIQLDTLAGLRLSYGHGVTPSCSIRDGRGFSLPVFGPLTIGVDRAYLPFVRNWKVSKVVRNPAALGDLDYAATQVPAKKKTYGTDGFANERANWQGKAGQAYFHSQIDLSEPMKLDFLMGYDGPFRLWLDGQPFFANLNGTNPCFADESRQTAKLAAGVHDITVAMDLNSGAAWGFFLRFERVDLSPAKIRSGNYAKPTYLK